MTGGRATGQAPQVAAFVTDGPLREGIASALRASGLRVRGLPGHAAAFGGCSGWADVSVVDAGGASGLAVLRRVTSCPACGARPVIAVVTFPDEGQRRRALAAGADAVALKRDGPGVAALARRLAAQAAG